MALKCKRGRLLTFGRLLACMARLVSKRREQRAGKCAGQPNGSEIAVQGASGRWMVHQNVHPAGVR